MKEIEYVIYLFFETYNLAFTFATLDLKANWKQYKDNFEKEIKK